MEIRYESPYVGGTRPYLKGTISRYKPILRQKFPDLVCYNIMKFLNNQWCVDIEEDLICTGRRLNLTFWHKGPLLDDEIKLYKNNKIPNVPWITISWYETILDSNYDSFDPELGFTNHGAPLSANLLGSEAVDAQFFMQIRLDMPVTLPHV